MKKTKNILIILLLAFFVVHAVQFSSGFIKVKPLYGVFNKTEVPSLNHSSWFSTSFQDSLNNRLDEIFGFRPTYIRIYNQIQFSIFKKTNNKSLLIGYDDYIFETEYIRGYTGADFVGTEKAKINVDRLKRIAEFLHSNNTKFLVIIAPSKAFYYSEYIPSEFIKRKDTTNYEYYSELLNKTEIPLLDANEWFLKMKNSSPYPLMPKAGIHWTKHGASLVADSINTYLESLFNRKLIHYRWDSIQKYTDHRGGEYDLGDLLNLYCPIPDQAYAYPFNFIQETNNDGFKPTTIVIGDSFYWSILDSIFMEPFKNQQFWFYYRSVFPIIGEQQKKVTDIDVISEIVKSDLVILEMSAQTLSQFGYRFLEEITNILLLSNEGKRNFFTNQIKDNIKKSPEWTELIMEKATQRNIPFDSMLNLDATWLADIKIKSLFKEN